MTASWPAPLPSPIMPRPLMLSSAWSPRQRRTPPSLCTHPTPSCCRSVALLSPNFDRASMKPVNDSFDYIFFVPIEIFCTALIFFTGRKRYLDSLHPECYSFYWWNPGALSTFCSTGPSSAKQQSYGGHSVVSHN